MLRAREAKLGPPPRAVVVPLLSLYLDGDFDDGRFRAGASAIAERAAQTFGRARCIHHLALARHAARVRGAGLRARRM
ncbi:hypothetical protein PUN4_190019 [Paraburkholderia unamae]|nr:hypothetical protein PUN4_190019 [Paraburkholderia unamae]